MKSGRGRKRKRKRKRGRRRVTSITKPQSTLSCHNILSLSQIRIVAVSKDSANKDRLDCSGDWRTKIKLSFHSAEEILLL